MLYALCDCTHATAHRTARDCCLILPPGVVRFFRQLRFCWRFWCTRHDRERLLKGFKTAGVQGRSINTFRCLSPSQMALWLLRLSPQLPCIPADQIRPGSGSRVFLPLSEVLLAEWATAPLAFFAYTFRCVLAGGTLKRRQRCAPHYLSQQAHTWSQLHTQKADTAARPFSMTPPWLDGSAGSFFACTPAAVVGLSVASHCQSRLRFQDLHSLL